MKTAYGRLLKHSIVQAKMVNKFPDIFIEPTPGEIVRLLKENKTSFSCRGIIEKETGLLAFDSQKLTHAAAAHVLDKEHGIRLPAKLSPEHQLTFVTSPVLDYKKIYIFTSQQAYNNPITDLKKFSKAWTLIEKQLSPVYVDYKHYDDARYYLQTATSRKELLDNLKFLDR